MKILVGFSGGVDSTASVVMLQKQGHEVAAATLPICGGTDISNVSEICDILSIKLHILNCSDIFQKNVIDYFIEANLSGFTPNPCVVCNEHVKFRAIFDFAVSGGFDKIATGHYAKTKEAFGKIRVCRGDDSKKDQSYVLSRVPHEIIEKTIFPMSSITRAEAEAMVFDLPTAKTSQDACFATGDTRGWISNKIGLGTPGDMITTDGKKVGTHDGLLAYTIGQKKGLRLGDGPWFVLKRDFGNNQLIIGRKNDVMMTSFKITDLRLDVFDELSVMTRYRSKAVPCKIDGNTVFSDEPIFAPTPGQFAVFYVGDVVVGSGVISG